MKNGDSLPSDADAEKAVLCSLILNPGFVAPLLSRISPEAFYSPAHQILFDLLLEWPHPDRQIDFVWVKKRLVDRDQLQEFGDKELAIHTLNNFWSFVPTSLNAPNYIETVADKYALRRCELLFDRLGKACHYRLADHGQILAEANEGLLKISRPIGADEQWIPESLVTLSRSTIDQSQVLLGNRWLERGQGAFLIGPSGIGKSVALIQLAVMAAAGRAVFGIPVRFPLKVIIVQSEDSRNDRIEMAQMLPAMGLSEPEQQLVDRNVRIVSVRGLAGANLLQALDAQLRLYGLQGWQADVVAINPLTAYLGGDETKPEVCTAFLRVGLDPILTRHNCSAIIAHHPPKTTHNPTDKFRYFDWQYRMAGSHHLTNWARATIGIEPTDSPGVFRFIAGKRGQRIGWADEAGKPVFERCFRHCKTPGVTLWEEVEGADIPKAKSKYKSVDLDKLLALVPVIDPELKDNFHQRAAESLQVGINKIEAGMRQLHVEEKVFSRSMPNPSKGRSYTGWAKTPGLEEQNGEVG